MDQILTKAPSKLEQYFAEFRKNIVGIDTQFETPYGTQPIIYADWIASGRLYQPIEDIMNHRFGPMVGNTHSESTETGRCMTFSYHIAHKIIKQHVNANPDDVIITCGSGMTGALAKFQRILGLRVPESMLDSIELAEEDRPVVFITHMEHHSNHTPWLESLADLVVLPPNENLEVDASVLEDALKSYENRKLKIGSFSACSNVTGMMPNYYKLAEVMHRNGGYCFVDFAASAPYVDINMHPGNPLQCLDAVIFSPHKFLGGPGSSGVLVFNKKLYKNRIPDHPGGGTVTYTNPWGDHVYFDDIEVREDGGTPGFLQAIRIALSIRLKEKMGVEKMHAREMELLAYAFEGLSAIPGLHILGDTNSPRIGVISFYLEGVHHNLVVQLLNDRYGIQVRGGCSCAGTYGHYLLNVNKDLSYSIKAQIDQGDLSSKPGWVRLSLHPTMTNAELDLVIQALKDLVDHVEEWKKDYEYSSHTNEYYHKSHRITAERFETWFDL